MVKRTVIHRAITKAMGKKINIKLNTTVKRIDQHEDRVDVVFNDGTRDSYDLVVGADGAHSQIRNDVFGEGYLKYHDWAVWAYWVPPEVKTPEGVLGSAAGGKLFFNYPLGNKTVAMFCASVHHNSIDPSEKRIDTLQNLFGSFDPLVQDIVKHAPESRQVFHDDITFVEMKEWYKGRVVLMGDAQHASSPIPGMGSSLAMEDAYVLARELKKYKKIENALHHYQTKRQKRITEFRRYAKRIDSSLMVRSSILSALRNVVMSLLPSSFFTKPIVSFLEKKI